MTARTMPAEIEARIEWFVEVSGLAALNQLGGVAEISRCLDRLKALTANEDALTMAFVETAVVARLKAADVANATKIVRLSLARAKQNAAPAGRPRATEVEPWGEAVDLPELLGELNAELRRYVVMDAPSALAAALWIIHTHCLDAADYSPRLAILSATKRCGKTTLMKLLAGLVHRPVSATNISAAALFRVIERDHPTLLIDEADTFLPDNEQMRGVLNAGHDRASGCVIRVDVAERGHELLEFDTWGPVAIALIGKLPGTLADRSITLRMRRKTNTDQVERLRRPQVEALVPLARKCKRWAADHTAALGQMPRIDLEQLDSRAADNWEPLLAIGNAAGTDWSQRTIKAAMVLSTRARERERDDDIGERLLADIRLLMHEGRFAGRVSMRGLVTLLVRDDDAPWATVSAGRQLTTAMLGRLLRTFDIEPRTLRMSGVQISKGYESSDFAASFARYLVPTRVTSVTPAESQTKTEEAARSQDPTVTGPDRAPNVNGCAVVTDVTDHSGSIRHESSNAGGGGE